VVPWDEHGEFIEDLFAYQVQYHLDRGLRHLYIFGTAGEGFVVTDRAFERIVRAFHTAMTAASAEAMVGVISFSLTEMVERIELARSIGVRQFQISLPSWGALADREVDAFFDTVCGRFADCRFLHYNLLRTKRLVTPQEYGRLAERHPNLVATKNSTDSMQRVEDLLRFAPQLQHFLNETGYVYGSLVGECGLLASLAPLNCEAARQFFEAGQRRDAPSLFELHGVLAGLNRELSRCVGDGAHMDGAFDKLLWRVHDERFPLRLLPPYASSTEEAYRRFVAVLRERYSRWLPA
jgi:dihydrodipicolinate synthase/N-acetylneuraminate lyase